MHDADMRFYKLDVGQGRRPKISSLNTIFWNKDFYKMSELNEILSHQIGDVETQTKDKIESPIINCWAKRLLSLLDRLD